MCRDQDSVTEVTEPAVELRAYSEFHLLRLAGKYSSEAAYLEACEISGRIPCLSPDMVDGLSC
jgi:hypothetical protein